MLTTLRDDLDRPFALQPPLLLCIPLAIDHLRTDRAAPTGTVDRDIYAQLNSIGQHAHILLPLYLPVPREKKEEQQ